MMCEDYTPPPCIFRVQNLPPAIHKAPTQLYWWTMDHPENKPWPNDTVYVKQNDFILNLINLAYTQTVGFELYQAFSV